MKLEEVRELLQDYTQFLMDHGYCDDDVWLEGNGAVIDFLNTMEVEK